jgi:putative peptidoglycan lipid II flippase
MIITGSFTDAQIKLMTSLTRLMLTGQFFFLFSSFLTGISHSYQRFLLPALSPLVYNLAIIAGIVLGAEKLGLYAPALGVLIGALLHAGVQAPLTWKLGFRYRWNQWNFKSAEIRELGKLMIPRTLSSGISQLEAMAAVFFATSLTSGSYVIFSLAQMLMFLPIRLVGVPVSQAAFPQLSKSFNVDKPFFVRLVSDSILQILYFILPITAILLVLRVPIVRLAYGTPNFPWEATLQTGYTLGFFTLAIPAQAINQLLIRGFYAQKDTRTPLLSGVVSMLIFLGLSWWFTFGIDWGQLVKGLAFINWQKRSAIDWNLLGLAVATSAASFAQLIILFWLFNRRVKLLTNSLVTPISKLLLTALLTVTFLWIPMWVLDDLVFDTTRVLPLLGLTVTATSIGLAVYFSLCHWLGVKEQVQVLALLHQLPAMKKSVKKLRALTSLATAPQSGLGDGKV